MKAVIQRVSEAKVTLKSDENQSGKISEGILVLLGIEQDDTENESDFLLNKIINLRIFDDPEGKMNLSLQDIGGDLMVISQFTILADTRKGRRPSFIRAGDPQASSGLVEYFIRKAKEKIKVVEKGFFGEHMKIELVNDGPATFILESK